MTTSLRRLAPWLEKGGPKVAETYRKTLLLARRYDELADLQGGDGGAPPLRQGPCILITFLRVHSFIPFVLTGVTHEAENRGPSRTI